MAKEKKRKSKERTREEQEENADVMEVEQSNLNGKIETLNEDEKSVNERDATGNDNDSSDGGIVPLKESADGEMPTAAKTAQEEDYQKEFKVLGVQQFTDLKAVKTKSLLVEQATTFPAEISSATKLPLAEKGIDFTLTRHLEDIRLKEFTQELYPVQREVLHYLFQEIENPQVFRKRDIVICSPTGSGKTWCYVLPIVCHPLIVSSSATALNRFYSEQALCHTYALIVVPSQQLVRQVLEELEKFRRPYLRVCGLSGAEDADVERRRLLDSPPHVLVSTPARLLLHLLDEAIDISKLIYLVIDEADSMGRSVRMDWLELVEKKANLSANISNSFAFARSSVSSPRKILLSATLSYDVDKLFEWRLFQPKLFLAVKSSHIQMKELSSALTDAADLAVSLPPSIENRMLICNKSLHPLLVFAQLKQHKFQKVLIFVAEIVAARRLGIVLSELAKESMIVTHLTSELYGKRRQTVLKRFAKSDNEEKTRVLISSDVLARGVDVQDIDCVINYDKPVDKRQYVHRGGRTGRSGKSGIVLTVCDDQREEIRFLRRICKEVCPNWSESNEQKVTEEDEDVAAHLQDYKEAIKTLKEKVEEGQATNRNHKGKTKRANTSGFKYRPKVMKRKTPWRSQDGEETNGRKKAKFD